MLDQATIYLVTLPNFIAYFAASLALTTLVLLIYTWVTPYREWELIRQGNDAAAISLSGAALGFVLPLASVIMNSLDLLDMVVWSAVAMLVQLGTFFVARLIKPQLTRDIAAGRTAPAVSLAGMSVVVGVLNAACMTY
jgi:putative membrane protein